MSMPYDALVERHLAGRLDDDGQRALAAHLVGDERRRCDYIDALVLHLALRGLLCISLTPSARHEILRLTGCAGAVDDPVHRRRRRRHRRRTPSSGWRAPLAAAAAVLIATIATVKLTNPAPGTTSAPTAVPLPIVADGPLRIIGRDGASAPGGELHDGDAIAASAAGRLVYRDGTTVDLATGTSLRLEEGGRRIALAQGRVEASVKRRDTDAALIIASPHAEILVLGTRFSVDCRGPSTSVEVAAGRVAVTERRPGGERIEVGAGGRALVDATNLRVERPIPPQVVPAGPPLDRWHRAGDLVLHHPARDAVAFRPRRREYPHAWQGTAIWPNQPVDAANEAATVAATLHVPGTPGRWHVELFVTASEARFDHEGQASPQLRLAVTEGVPLVATWHGDDRAQRLWTGDTLPQGAHRLELRVRGAEAEALVDGSVRWRGAHGMTGASLLVGLRGARKDDALLEIRLEAVHWSVSPLRR